MSLPLPQTSSNEPFCFCSHQKWQQAEGSDLSLQPSAPQGNANQAKWGQNGLTSFTFEEIL